MSFTSDVVNTPTHDSHTQIAPRTTKTRNEQTNVNANVRQNDGRKPFSHYEYQRTEHTSAAVTAAWEMESCN